MSKQVVGVRCATQTLYELLDSENFVDGEERWMSSTRRRYVWGYVEDPFGLRNAYGMAV